MFTGLVQAVGRVASAEHRPGGGVRLLIDPAGWSHTPAIGDSIAVAGCCLTVAAKGPTGWAFDAIPETLAKTRLGALRPGDRVNLEHAVTASTLMGGHFVQGHIDGVGAVERVQTGADYRVTLRPPADLMTAMVPKGSVCLDGVSLTLAEVAADTITVALIPVTLELTTLAALRRGDPVNIEADLLVKSVATVLARMGLRPPAPGPHP